MNQITSRVSKSALLLLALAFTALPVMADTVTVSGSTAGGPMFNRPDEGQPPTSLSPSATAVPYRRIRFTVSAPGLYSLTAVSTSFATNGYNPFLVVYVNNFNPDPAIQLDLANALAANDSGGSSTALMNIFLSPGVNYLAVVTGSANDDFGALSTTFSGPGTITIVPSTTVPEPATLILLGTGLAGVAARARRGRKANRTTA